MLQAGSKIGDSVELIEPLEDGGMGSVWIGKHLSMPGMRVAVKFVLEDLAQREPSVLDRFHREATVLDRVKHPHIVKLFEYDKLPDGTPYIVMELLQGESLVERLERDGVLALDAVGKLLAQSADALEAMHAQRIVHRDLKCENVYLTGDADQICVKLIDFGLAKTPEQPGLPQLTVAGAVIGTAEYMSPEQIVSAKDVDHRADLWALGVLAYVATTLSLPFRGDKLSEVFGAIRSSRFTPASRLRADLPEGIDAWFARAFHADRAQRFAGAGEMAAAWAAALVPSGPDRRVIYLAVGISAALLLIAGAILLSQ